jgi:hypothetical protein
MQALSCSRGADLVPALPRVDGDQCEFLGQEHVERYAEWS